MTNQPHIRTILIPQTRIIVSVAGFDELGQLITLHRDGVLLGYARSWQEAILQSEQIYRNDLAKRPQAEIIEFPTPA